MCVVVVLIFVLLTVCCLPSRTCLYFVFAFSYFHHVRLCSQPLSWFSARLRALTDPLTVGHPCVGFHLLISVRFTLVRAFVLRSRTRYSCIPYPSDYMFVRWHVCLSNHYDSRVDFYFVDLVRNSGRVNFCSF
jgi:hypothetical protein